MLLGGLSVLAGMFLADQEYGDECNESQEQTGAHGHLRVVTSSPLPRVSTDGQHALQLWSDTHLFLTAACLARTAAQHCTKPTAVGQDACA